MLITISFGVRSTPACVGQFGAIERAERLLDDIKRADHLAILNAQLHCFVCLNQSGDTPLIGPLADVRRVGN